MRRESKQKCLSFYFLSPDQGNWSSKPDDFQHVTNLEDDLQSIQIFR